MKLYEITEEIMNLVFEADERLEQAQTEEEFEQIDGKLYKRFRELQMKFEDKIEGVAMLDRNLRADIEALKEEEKRLAERRKSIERRRNWILSYAEAEMIATDIKNVKTDKFTIYVGKNPASLIVKSEDDIPEEFFKVEKRLMKRDLLKHIKDTGEIFDGVDIVQTESIKIR